jgi:argininosuccinate lyase
VSGPAAPREGASAAPAPGAGGEGATLWAKGGDAPDPAIMRFLAGEDVLADRALLPYDIAATAAHAAGLGRVGVLAPGDVERLRGELAVLADDFAAGRFVLDDRYEDGHTAIEARLTERLGELGKRVHAGRSRNDQVQVALRLYMRARLGELARVCLDSAGALLDRAEASALTPMPGYTHGQRAMPSSIGHWLAGYAEAFVDDATYASLTARWLGQNPLGTASGFGVNLPLDRDGVARELGFERLQLNPGYVQNSRGKFELAALGALGQALLDLRRLAWDLSLYSTAEFGFVSTPERYTTGSSLMPNKRNPDVIELLRAAYARCAGAQAETAALLSLPGGYHRDLQATKPPLVGALSQGLSALSLLPGLVRDLRFDEARMRAAISPEMYATDRAIELSVEGVPFREAYRQIAGDLAAGGERSPEASLAARVSAGAPGNLGLELLRQRLEAARVELEALGLAEPLTDVGGSMLSAVRENQPDAYADDDARGGEGEHPDDLELKAPGRQGRRRYDAHLIGLQRGHRGRGAGRAQVRELRDELGAIVGPSSAVVQLTRHVLRLHRRATAVVHGPAALVLHRRARPLMSVAAPAVVHRAGRAALMHRAGRAGLMHRAGRAGLGHRVGRCVSHGVGGAVGHRDRHRRLHGDAGDGGGRGVRRDDLRRAARRDGASQARRGGRGDLRHGDGAFGRAGGRGAGGGQALQRCDRRAPGGTHFGGALEAASRITRQGPGEEGLERREIGAHRA